MDAAPAQLSPRESRFERGRQAAGFVLAPLVFLALWLLAPSGLSPEAQRLLPVIGAVVTLWMTEALPLPVTALLGPALCVLLGVAPAREVFRGFADPIIFLFLGSFLMAGAMLRHGLNRRVAFWILGLRGVGGHPARLLGAFGAITGLISMWVSNTATTAMMFPIALAILGEMARRQGRTDGGTGLPFATALMLVTAFAASIGGLGTPVGTPPNLIGLGLIESRLGVRISFFQWMALGVPLAAVMIVFLVLWLRRACPTGAGEAADGAAWLAAERQRLGGWSAGQLNTLLAFGLTVACWLAPGAAAVALGAKHPATLWLNAHLPESIVALAGALLLFALPISWTRREFTLEWRDAARIDWGTILLFGGGLALGELMFSTKLAEWLGTGLAGALQAHSTVGLVALFTALAIFLSETTSNTASATMVVPVAIAVGQAAGINPVLPALGACLGASMGFMLPVSTPPNAIVYGSGCVPLLKMARNGFALDIAGFVVIVPAVSWLAPWIIRH
jgi:sodium-dependent dicarboxylate transporter 2/3/5